MISRRALFAGRMARPALRGWCTGTLPLVSRQRSSPASSEQCWKCGREIAVSWQEARFTCPCEQRVVLPPASRNYFTVLSCPIAFSVDMAQLKQRYKQLQQTLHPDRFANKPPVEQEFAAEQSSLVNKAYSTLMKPYSRGLYLLKLQGLIIDEKDNTAVAPGDMEFLAEVMATNEEIHEANPEPRRLRAMRTDNLAKLNHCIAEIESCFVKGDFPGAKDGLARMKYLLNIQEDLTELLDIE